MEFTSGMSVLQLPSHEKDKTALEAQQNSMYLEK